MADDVARAVAKDALGEGAQAAGKKAIAEAASGAAQKAIKNAVADGVGKGAKKTAGDAADDLLKDADIQAALKEVGTSKNVKELPGGIRVTRKGISLPDGSIIAVDKKGKVLGYGADGKYFRKGGDSTVDIGKLNMTDADIAKLLDEDVLEVAAKRTEWLKWITENPKFILGTLTLTSILIYSVVAGKSPIDTAKDLTKDLIRAGADNLRTLVTEIVPIAGGGIADFFNSLGIGDFFKKFGLYIGIGCACILMISIFMMLK
jgi:hypothetical protein